MTTIEQANKFLAKLDAAIASGAINKYTADDEVFAEMENGDHDKAVEDLYYSYTRK